MGSPIVAGFGGLLTPSIGGFRAGAVGLFGPPKAAAPAGEVIATTIGDGSAFNQYGYNEDISAGSVAPTTLNGQHIEYIIYNFNVSPARWQIRLTGSLAQNFFDTITYETSTGSITFNSADAVAFVQNPSDTAWSWEDNTESWGAGDVGLTYDVTVTF